MGPVPGSETHISRKQHFDLFNLCSIFLGTILYEFIHLLSDTTGASWKSFEVVGHAHGFSLNAP